MDTLIRGDDIILIAVIFHLTHGVISAVDTLISGWFIILQGY